MVFNQLQDGKKILSCYVLFLTFCELSLWKFFEMRHNSPQYTNVVFYLCCIQYTNNG